MTNAVRVALAAVNAPASITGDPGLGVVWFAGGGGSSEGLREAGFAPDYALNHNGTALAMHQVNHPDCVHLCDDAMANHTETLAPGRRVCWFWASPDCTHFSVARGGAPKSPRIRGLAWCVVDWAEKRRPDVIFVENVKEFTTWGPLDESGQPVRSLAGTTFREWVGRLEAAGYAVEWRVLNAADYGAPTTRKRLFVLARCDGEPIVWPAPTHAPRKEARARGLKPYVSAASIIDWSEPCPSIFLSRAVAKALGLRVKRPLVAATLSRIAKGLERYVIGAAEPFIVPLTHYGERRPMNPRDPLPSMGANRGELAALAPTIVPILNAGWSPDRVDAADDPLRTITAAKGGEFAVSAAQLKPSERLRAASVTVFQENIVGSDPRDPMHTVMAGATRFGVLEGDLRPQSAYLVPRYGEGPGQEPRALDIAEPYPTAVPTGNGGQLVAATLARQFGASVGGDVADPAGTVMASGSGKTQLIAANLTTYYGTGTGSDASEPLRTVTGEDRHGLVSTFLEQANTGMVGHEAGEPLSTVTGRGTQQRLIEARLAAIGVDPDSRRRAVLTFLWDHFGEPTEAELADPVSTAQGRLRFGLVIVKGQVWEIADIGMRMLKPRELFNAQGFRPDYIIDRDAYGNAINGTAATLMVGNSVPPPLARVLAAANLTPGEPMRAAA